MALDFGKRLIRFPKRGFLQEISDHEYVRQTYFKTQMTARMPLVEGIWLMMDDDMYNSYKNEFNFTCKKTDGDEIRIYGPAIFYIDNGLTEESIQKILYHFDDQDNYLDASKLKSE
ncbi:hypothetical protein [Bacillus paranthracis]|uniref:hypothetical protein n=1 Tax=Bacillus paranthracis TaxID=2026186 RepID=UPI00158331A3|nr:hypothetical protein [Bacillus paranthracis]NUJ08491.1 hypothetical protein [Bacillus paranthracis]